MGTKRELKKKIAKARARKRGVIPALFKPIYDPSQRGYYIEAWNKDGTPIFFGDIHGKLSESVREFRDWVGANGYTPVNIEDNRSYA